MFAKTLAARILKSEGVDHLTRFPNNGVIATAAEAAIRPISGRSERVAVNIAAGRSRVAGGGRVGVAAVRCSRGAGLLSVPVRA